MDKCWDHEIRKALHSWVRLWVQFASFTLGHLVTVFHDASIALVTKHTIASKPVSFSVYGVRSRVEWRLWGGILRCLVVSETIIHLCERLRKPGAHNKACGSPGIREANDQFQLESSPKVGMEHPSMGKACHRSLRQKAYSFLSHEQASFHDLLLLSKGQTALKFSLLLK